MDEDFAWFLEQFGDPTESVRVQPETGERFRGKLPDQLLAYWNEVGFASFKNGLFVLTNPDEYEPAFEEWVGDTELVEKDAYYVIARTAFGKLFLWGTKTGYMYDVNPVQGWIYGEDRHTGDIGAGNADECLARFFSGTNPEDLDIKDADGKPLFERAVAKLGPLAMDEVFAFEPALTAGGTAKLDNLAKRNIHVHLSLLAQLGPREILDRQALARKAFG
jgi:hypothetical protein